MMEAFKRHPCADMIIKSDLDTYIDYSGLLSVIPQDSSTIPTYFGRRHCCQPGCVNGEVEGFSRQVLQFLSSDKDVLDRARDEAKRPIVSRDKETGVEFRCDEDMILCKWVNLKACCDTLCGQDCEGNKIESSEQRWLAGTVRKVLLHPKQYFKLWVHHIKQSSLLRQCHDPNKGCLGEHDNSFRLKL
jgi:hypothetical protein